MAARITVSTINLRFNRHLLAFMKFCNILSDLCDLSGYFRTLEKSLNNRMGRPLKIRPSHLQDTAILLGGIYVVLKEFLKVENLRLKPAVTENDM